MNCSFSISCPARTCRATSPKGANHRQGESIYREWEPITGRGRVYTGSVSQIDTPHRSQSQAWRGYIPGVGANRHPPKEPITGRERV
eukprot:9487794-Pyramimonas_sp.AAC.2